MPRDKEFVPITGWQERPEPFTTPQPGAGIGVRLGRGIIGLDYDNEDAALRVSEALGGSPVNKAGATAWTEFYRASFPIPSENFVNNDGELMLQVLSDGRQTVIPPSVHPDTEQPYRWTNGKSLYDTAPDELPELPADYRERIIALGYQPGGKKKKTDETNDADGPTTFDGPFAEINDLAMQNLPLWVPDLNLPRCQRRRGRGASYEAVPNWRPATKGLPLAQRKLNLKISPRHGIVDFGDGGKGYSPLDLVMAARGCSLSEAMAWLEERVCPKRPDVDFEALGANKGEQTHAKTQAGADTNTDRKILEAAGAWFHGSAPPPDPECSYEGLLPRRGAGLLVAQYGCNKTHVLADLCVATSAPDVPGKDITFAGRKRLFRGGVVYIEFENSNIPIRIAAIAKNRDIVGRLPLIGFSEAPPIVIRKKVNSEAIKWYRNVLSAAHREFMREFGVPLTLVGVDPLVDAADFENENDNSETNRAMRAFDRLGTEFNCIVAVNDHAGKDLSRGARGGSSKPSKAHFIFTLPEKVADRAQRRIMTIKKLRGMPDGWGVEHWFELIEVETASGNIASNLAVCWGKEVEGENDASDDKDRGRLSKHELRALRALETLITARAPARSGHVTWVMLSTWFATLVTQRIIDAKSSNDQHKVFRRMRDGLRDKGYIQIDGDRVCVPL
jgi:hypothetical protein